MLTNDIMSAIFFFCCSIRFKLTLCISGQSLLKYVFHFSLNYAIRKGQEKFYYMLALRL
jgi:hypothetical protein